jgi:hypothetical protein
MRFCVCSGNGSLRCLRPCRRNATADLIDPVIASRGEVSPDAVGIPRGMPFQIHGRCHKDAIRHDVRVYQRCSTGVGAVFGFRDRRRVGSEKPAEGNTRARLRPQSHDGHICPSGLRKM